MLALVICYAFLALATLTLLLPLGQVWSRWKGYSDAQKLFALYIGLELATEVISFILGRMGRTNIWVAHIVMPIEAMIIVYTFAAWQVDRSTHLWLSRAAPLMLLFWVPAVLGWEPLNDFNIGTDSMEAIICLAVAAYTVVRRFFEDDGPAVDRDWFWIGAGVMLYFATSALMLPLIGYLSKVSRDTAIATLSVQGGFGVFANVLYYYGMRCPSHLQNSGYSSSLPQSSQPFSWSRWVRP